MPPPGTLIPWVNRQFTDADGNPLVGGLVYPFVTGTSTPKDTFADATRDVALTHPVVLDGEGRATIFLEPGGYDFIVHDIDDVLQYTVEGVEDVGLTYISQLGITLATGTLGVVSGYQIVEDDQFITAASTGGADPCIILLPSALNWGLPITIKNAGTEPLAVTPVATETIDLSTAAFTVPAASAPTYPSIVLISDGVAAWWVQASHGF